jgi:hypothetical protein
MKGIEKLDFVSSGEVLRESSSLALDRDTSGFRTDVSFFKPRGLEP